MVSYATPESSASRFMMYFQVNNNMLILYHDTPAHTKTSLADGIILVKGND